MAGRTHQATRQLHPRPLSRRATRGPAGFTVDARSVTTKARCGTEVTSVHQPTPTSQLVAMVYGNCFVDHSSEDCFIDESISGCSIKTTNLVSFSDNKHNSDGASSAPSDGNEGISARPAANIENRQPKSQPSPSEGTDNSQPTFGEASDDQAPEAISLQQVMMLELVGTIVGLSVPIVPTTTATASTIVGLTTSHPPPLNSKQLRPQLPWRLLSHESSKMACTTWIPNNQRSSPLEPAHQTLLASQQHHR